MRIAVIVLVCLALGLSACGKRGGPKPPADAPDRYPKSYPAT